MVRVLSIFGYLIFALNISISDLEFRIIRNRDLLWFSGFTFVLNWKQFSSQTLIQILVATLLLATLHLVFSGRIGAGDLKLFWIISFWPTSFSSWLQSFSLCWVLGGISSAFFVLIFRRYNGNIPFAPFIFSGFFASIL